MAADLAVRPVATFRGLRHVPLVALSHNSLFPSLEIWADGVALRIIRRHRLRFEDIEAVDLRWSTDRALDLHLHGLRIEARAEPDRPAITTVSTRSAGRFAVETHDTAGRHATILYIEIHPR